MYQNTVKKHFCVLVTVAYMQPSCTAPVSAQGTALVTLVHPFLLDLPVPGGAAHHPNLVVKGQTHLSPTLRCHHQPKASSHLAPVAQKGYGRLFGKPAAQSPAAKHCLQQSLSEVSEQSPDATAAVETPPVNRETGALNSSYKPISFISPCAAQKHLIHPQPFFPPRLAAGKAQTTATQAETVQPVRTQKNSTV